MSARKLTVSIETLGCRLNQYESDGIIRRFIESGRYAAAAPEECGDIAIVNSCTVTDQADSRNRSLVRSILKRNPAARVVFTGCMAQTDPEKARALPGVALVVGNDRKSALFDLVDEWLQQADASADIYTPQYYAESARDALAAEYGARPVLHDPFAYGAVRPVGHTRAYLKIQEGCDRKCTYCKIPQARGRGVSRSAADILDHVRRLDEEGAGEIVLTGVNLGWYRDREAELRFVRLVETMLESLSHARLRLSSIEPCDVDAPLARLSLHPRFCDFLHVPLQSGSTRILREMRRTYSAESFRRRMETVLEINPRLFIGTDVIAGFPGETEADFLESYNLCQDLGMANIHAFRFSPRAGTPAAARTDRPDSETVRERMQRLAGLKEQGWTRYATGRLGEIRTVIVEKVDGDVLEGLADNFLRVRWRAEPGGREVQRGELARVRLVQLDGTTTVIGESPADD